MPDFDGFSQNALQIFIFAGEEAAAMGHEYISPEHILLGILRSSSTDSEVVLSALGFKIDEVRAAIVEENGEGEPLRQVSPPLDADAHEVVEQARHLARMRAEAEVVVHGTDVLIALAESDHNFARDLLMHRGAGSRVIRYGIEQVKAGREL